MPYPVCGEFASYLVDVYLLVIVFICLLFGSFMCCCMSKCRSSQDEKNTSKVSSSNACGDGEGRAPAVVEIFCGDELICCKPKEPKHKMVAVSVVVRFIMAFVVGLLLMWLLLTIIFVGAQQMLMYPAELATACTPCEGDLATITFQDYSTASADRNPYCCSYSPSPYLNVSFLEQSQICVSHCSKYRACR